MNDVFWTTSGDLADAAKGVGVVLLILAALIVYDWLREWFPGWWAAVWRWVRGSSGIVAGRIVTFKGRKLIPLWWHCLLRLHRMSWIRDLAGGPKTRFCWECDKAALEAELGEPLP